jgi:hypothetical protein
VFHCSYKEHARYTIRVQFNLFTFRDDKLFVCHSSHDADNIVGTNAKTVVPAEYVRRWQLAETDQRTRETSKEWLHQPKYIAPNMLNHFFQLRVKIPLESQQLSPIRCILLCRNQNWLGNETPIGTQFSFSTSLRCPGFFCVTYYKS